MAKKTNSLIIALIVLIVIFSIVFVFAIQISNFDGFGTSENLTFTGDENITRNLTISKNANVTSAFMNLSGIELPATFNPQLIFTPSDGGTELGFETNGTYFWITDRDGDEIEEYYYNGTYSRKFSVASQMTDPFDLYFNGTHFFIVGEYTKNVYVYNFNGTYENSISISGTLGTGFYGIAGDGSNFWLGTWESSSLGHIYKMDSSLSSHIDNVSLTDGVLFGLTTTENYIWWCYYLRDCYRMNKDYSNIISSGTGAGFGITSNETNVFIIRVVFTPIYNSIINTMPDNLSIIINNTNIWNHTGEFNSTFSPNKTDDFSSTLNTALNLGVCDCDGCSLSGDNCIIPFLFHSDTAGILEYSNLDIQYRLPPSYMKLSNSRFQLNDGHFRIT